MKGLIVVEPHASWLLDGTKKWLLKSKVYNDYVGIDLVVVSKDQALGVIRLGKPRPLTIKQFKETFYKHRVTDDERKAWWPDATILYAYDVEIVNKYLKPKKVFRPVGPQTFLPEVKFV